ncbi:tetratricopeptide repeat protein [Methyloprofundus sp.]|uniref:tetratricopeptide repeat protein n=1 Tax=Methyloprofundus sp. TaxID=2020875 RepID=UPI003D0DCC16
MTLRKISILAVCLFVFLLPIPENSYAFEWQDLWQTSQQQAQQEYLNGDYQQAAEQFTDPAWQAAARYKADKKLREDEQMLPATTDTGFYNQGNVLAKSGQLEKSIGAYDQALKLNPDNQDAQYNKELVEKALEQQNKDQKEQQEDQSGDQQEQQDQQSEQSEQQSEQQESQDGQDSDQKPQQDATNEADQEQEKENEQPQNAEAKEQEKQQQEAEAEAAQAKEQDAQDTEQQQANEQWLKRIPDDPSGLLKRKFKYQYGKQKQQQNSGQQW